MSDPLHRIGINSCVLQMDSTRIIEIPVTLCITFLSKGLGTGIQHVIPFEVSPTETPTLYRTSFPKTSSSWYGIEFEASCCPQKNA